MPIHHQGEFGWTASYFRARCACFRSRTPDPPPFSSMNCTPAASQARSADESIAEKEDSDVPSAGGLPPVSAISDGGMSQ
jgi:hypothetical protein